MINKNIIIKIKGKIQIKLKRLVCELVIYMLMLNLN